MRLFKEMADKPMSKPGMAKLDWDKAMDDCKKLFRDKPFTTRDFYEEVIHGEVDMNVVRKRLNRLQAQGKLLRVTGYGGAYIYLWPEGAY